MTMCVNYHRSFSTELAERPYSRTVLIAVDASKPSEQAFLWYMKTVHRPLNRVLLVHIPEGCHIESSGYGSKLTESEVSSYVETQNKTVDEMISKYQERLEAANVNAIYRIVIGKPGEIIINVAKSEDASLIVLGTRGMGKLRRTILGSVSDYVTQHSNVPVIVYRS